MKQQQASTSAENGQQVVAAAGKAAFDVCSGNIVPAMGHPLRYPQFGHFHVGQCQVDQLGAPALLVQPPNQPEVTAARQRGFKGEILAIGSGRFDLAQKQAARGHQLALWCQRRQAGGIRSALMKREQ
ncbi:MAG: hypothetical protein KGZ67_13120 [Hydrogenophaga sp.]|nr:hypothetical protein [Hydrogenophaga sp.]